MITMLVNQISSADFIGIISSTLKPLKQNGPPKVGPFHGRFLCKIFRAQGSSGKEGWPCLHPSRHKSLIPSLVGGWFKHAKRQIGSFSTRDRGENSKSIFELPPPGIKSHTI